MQNQELNESFGQITLDNELEAALGIVQVKMFPTASTAWLIKLLNCLKELN